MTRWALAALFGLVACAAEPGEVAAEDVSAPDGGVALFTQVLKQHRALNARVERVSHRIMTANADLCPRTHRVSGLSVHTLSDYPRNLRPLAETLMGVSDGVSVRSVVRGGPADAAGIEADDVVRHVGGMPIAPSVAAGRYWAMAEGSHMQDEDVTLGLLREGERVEATVETIKACDYGVEVVFSETPNAHTDGETIQITSELVRRTGSDSRLAQIIAHELAHAVAHAGTDIRGQAAELDADAKGLVLLARAGFDLDEAIAEMDDFGRRFTATGSATHPDHAARVEALKRVRGNIARRLAGGGELTLD